MHTPQQIDQAFNELKDRVLANSKEGTSCEDVLQLMVDKPEKIWWMSYEVNNQVNSKGKFLSHRACARAGDLANFSPQLVEDRSIGRLKAYRLRTENMHLIEARLGNKKTVDKPKQRKVEFATVNGKVVVKEMFV